jgi:hypothetical protein
MKRRLKKLLAAPFVLLAAVIVLVEDWLWDDLLRLATALGRLPVLRQLETLVAALPPYGALVCFAAPSLLLVPVKLVALWCLAHGQATLGLLTVIAAKIIGTALVARIYALTEPKLLCIAWFAAWHARFVAFKARVYAVIAASGIYQTIQQQKLHLKTWLRTRGRGLLRQRWEAAVRLSRK